MTKKFKFLWDTNSMQFDYRDTETNQEFNHTFLLGDEPKEHVMLLTEDAPVTVDEAAAPVSENPPVTIDDTEVDSSATFDTPYTEPAPVAPDEPVAPVSVPEDTRHTFPILTVPEPSTALVSVPENTKPNVDVLVHADDETKPTTWVRMPDELPQIVSVQAKKTPNDISAMPQVVAECSDASVCVPPDSKLVAVPTAPGKSDVIVAIPNAMDGIDENELLDALKKAFDLWENAAPLPDVSPETPDSEKSTVISQVVQVSISGNEAVLKDISESVSKNLTLMPVKTPPGMPNIIAAFDQDTLSVFEKYNINPAEQIHNFIDTSNVTVASAVPLNEKDVYDSNDLEVSNDYPMQHLKRWRKQK